MREKYVDEKVGVWFIFGTSSDDPNLVDVNDGTRDVFTNVPKDVAEQLCQEQALFRDNVYKLMQGV